MAGEYILVFDIAGTDITLRHRRQETTASSLRADKCCFYFGGDWGVYGGKIALFGADRDRLKPVLLSADVDEEQHPFYYCYIPRDVLAQLSAGGKIYIAVQGAQVPAGFSPVVTDAIEQVSCLRTKFYTLNIADSGQIEFYITAQEEADFLAKVGASLSTMRSEASAAIATLEGKSIQSVVINASHELVITMQNGTVYNLGNVKGTKGDKGDTGATGATGAQGVPGVPGTDGADGEDGVSITGVTASLDTQNRRVFTFAFSDGTMQGVIVPGEVITVTDEQGQDPQAITVQAAVQGLANSLIELDDDITANSNRITDLNASKADKIIVTGTDNKNYYVQFGMQSGKPALILTEVQTNE